MSEGRPFEPTDFDNYTPLETKDAAEVSNAHPFVKEARDMARMAASTAMDRYGSAYPYLQKTAQDFLAKYFPEKKESE